MRRQHPNNVREYSSGSISSLIVGSMQQSAVDGWFERFSALCLSSSFQPLSLNLRITQNRRSADLSAARYWCRAKAALICAWGRLLMWKQSTNSARMFAQPKNDRRIHTFEPNGADWVERLKVFELSCLAQSNKKAHRATILEPFST